MDESEVFDFECTIFNDRLILVIYYYCQRIFVFAEALERLRTFSH